MNDSKPQKSGEEVAREPMLVGSMRRFGDHAEHVRLVNGSGTTIRNFLAEFDEYVEAKVTAAKAEAWDAALVYVKALADPAHSIEIHPRKPLVVMADLGQAERSNPYRSRPGKGATDE